MSTTKVVRWTLTIMLIFYFVSSLLVVIFNRDYLCVCFFGHCLESIKADCWLLTNGVIGLIIGYSLIKKWNHSFLASFLFFLVNFINSLFVSENLIVFSSFFHSLGFTISSLGLVVKDLEKGVVE